MGEKDAKHCEVSTQSWSSDEAANDSDYQYSTCSKPSLEIASNYWAFGHILIKKQGLRFIMYVGWEVFYKKQLNIACFWKV